MEILKCEMSIDTYKVLPDEIKKSIVVIHCEPKEFDYSNNEEWQRLKKESTKAYKKLKNFEYDMRHGNS